MVLVIASGFGLGYVPLIPGSVGALLGVGLYLLMTHARLAPVPYAAVCVGIILVAVLVAGAAERLYRRKDYQRIVIDEIASVPPTFFLVPFSWKALVVGYALNRLLDIVKPFPARRSQLLRGGLGVVADDIVAAVYANLLLHVLLWTWPSFLRA